MLNNQTAEKLRSMKLPAMAAEFIRQTESPGMDALGFEERVGMMTDAEWLSRENNRIKKLNKEANLRVSSACFADIDYRPSRKLDRAYIARLSDFSWVRGAKNLIVTGATGTGKTWLACAFGAEACRREIKVSYYRVSRLLNELRISAGDGSLTKLLNKLKKAELLILDDWGVSMLSPADGQFMLEVLEDRCELSSTVITAQAPVSKWHDLFEDPTLADAILDRVVSNAYRIELQGPSLRRQNAGNDAAFGGKNPISILDDSTVNVDCGQINADQESGVANADV